MEIVFNIAAPVFGLALLGYIAAHFGWLKEGAAQTLATFVFNFAAPALLFRAMARSPLPGDLPFDFLVAYYGSSLAVALLTWFVGKAVFRQGAMESVIAGMTGCFSNSVMFGIPLVLTAFGDAAAQPFFLLLAFHGILYFSTVTVALELVRAGGGGLLSTLIQSLKGILGNPLILALVIGIFWGETGWGLPAAADRFLDLLAQAVIPCALFSTGAALRQYRLAGNLMDSITVSFIKLIIHPLIVWVAAAWIFELPPLWTAVAVLLAAMPTGVNAYIFAERYGAWHRRAGSVVLLTSMAAIVTVTLVLLLLGKPT